MDANTFENDLLTSIEKQNLEETYHHEFFHCCQIATTGFLSYYTAQFLKEIAPVWRKLTEEGVLSKKTMSQILSAVFEDTPDISDNMNQLFSNMDKLNENSSLTSRMIIESQAYFIQKCLSDTSLDHALYMRSAHNAPSIVYIQAYLLASEYLGDQTFIYFNSIVYGSLLFFEPQNVFEKICANFSPYANDSQDSVAVLKNIVHALSKDHLYLGDSGDVSNKYIRNKEINPFYKPNILLLRSISSKYGNDFFYLMANPLSWFKDTIKRLDVPIILNPGSVFEHSVDKDWEVFNKSYNKKLHLILATICLIIENQHQNVAPHYLHLRGTTPANQD